MEIGAIDQSHKASRWDVLFTIASLLRHGVENVQLLLSLGDKEHAI